MKYTTILSITLTLSALATQGQHSTPQRPPVRPATSCCGQPALRPAFTGGNRPGLAATTTASTADIAIVVQNTSVSKTTDGGWRFTTAIANDNGNNCTPQDNTRAILQLPADCQVQSVTATQANNTPATWTQCGAYIEVQLGAMCPADGKIGSPAIITVILKSSPYTSAACIPAFGVSAFSGMPDHVPGNNYWWWREQCTEGMTSYPKEQPLPTKGL